MAKNRNNQNTDPRDADQVAASSSVPPAVDPANTADVGEAGGIVSEDPDGPVDPDQTVSTTSVPAVVGDEPAAAFEVVTGEDGDSLALPNGSPAYVPEGWELWSYAPDGIRPGTICAPNQQSAWDGYRKARGFNSTRNETHAKRVG